MKKWINLLLTLVMALSLFGCSQPETDTPDSDTKAPSVEDGPDDGLVSIWLVTSETEYDADGSNGMTRETYTYTDKGLPLPSNILYFTDALENQ